MKQSTVIAPSILSADFARLGDDVRDVLDERSVQLKMRYAPRRTQSLLRELVLSATYRQAHRATPERLERDPHNRLLARGPVRLTPSWDRTGGAD